MVLTDTFLEQLAGVINGESFTSPSHAGWSSTISATDTAATTLTGEFGSRTSLSGSRNNTITTFNGVKTGATVGSSGELLMGAGLFNASTSGSLFAELLIPSLLQTSSFDVELDWIVKFQRK